MLTLSKLRELSVKPTGEGRPPFVYAASGLVRINDFLYIVADDELHLAMFEAGSDSPGTWIRLFPDSLPIDYGGRKKVKPDLESITFLKPYEYAPAGALLMVPSMSRKNRVNGALLALDDRAKISAEPIPIDFSSIFKKLDSLLVELNIEGTAVLPKTIKFFHRGTQGKSKSAVIEVDAPPFLKDLHDSHVPSGDHIVGVEEYELGDEEGVPFQFTDAVGLPDGRVIFLAAAEDTIDAFEDGKCFGSELGVISASGKLERIIRIAGTDKLEGLSPSETASIGKGEVSSTNAVGSVMNLLFVSDTDNEKIPGCLFQATIELN